MHSIGFNMKTIIALLIGFWTSMARSDASDFFNFSRISDSSYLQEATAGFYTRISKAEHDKLKFDKNVIVINNLPPIRQMGGKGLCSACGPANLIQKMECDIKQNHNCSNIKTTSNSELVSLVGVFAQNDYRGYDIIKIDDKFRYGNGYIKYSSDTAIDFIGGDPYVVLKNIQLSNFELYTEACYPYDDFSNNVNFKDPTHKGIFDSSKTDYIFETLEIKYNEARKKLKIDQKNHHDIRDADVANQRCEDCITQLQSQIYDIGKIQEESKILRALNEDTFATFLYVVLFSNCYDKLKKFPKPKNIVSYPEKSTELSADDLINKISEVLARQKPIILNHVCPLVSKKDSEICLGVHTTTITGIKDVCDNNNPNNCIKYFRLQECYGEDWKEEYGEWFEAEPILKNIIPKNTDKVELSDKKVHDKFKRISSLDKKNKYQENTLIWLDY